MKRILFGIMASVLVMPLIAVAAQAAPDQYPGDTTIYETVDVQPNVLLILDNSGSMNDLVLPGDPYDPLITYPITNTCAGGNKACETIHVYKCVAFGLDCDNWVDHVSDVADVATWCPASPANPNQSLMANGQWNSSNRRLKTNGQCSSGSGIYATGNWVNWREQVSGVPRPKIDVAKEVVNNLINTTNGVKFGLMIFNHNQGGSLVENGGYTAEVKDMDKIFSGSTTNREALTAAVNSLTADNWTPLGETLFESMRYYQGGQTAFNGSFTYTSPIEADCQQNYVVLITDGMSTQDSDNVLKTICNQGDCDFEGFEPAGDPGKSYDNQGSDYLDDVAKFMKDSDLSSTFAGTQNVTTYTIGFGLGGGNPGAVKLLQETAQNGGGQAFITNDHAEMVSALTQILWQIFESDTSFVAPVVPVSPENRTYSGSRVYLGFFQPQLSSGFWYGNLKKYGIDADGLVVDRNGVPATDNDGSFVNSAISYWSAAVDGGEVDSGGAGEVLYNRDFNTNPRKIYTYLGSNADLTNSTNAFTKTNPDLDPVAHLAVANATEKDDLIDFVHGLDVFDEDLDGDSTEKRQWILGDILHSKPQVVSYATYAFTDANEANCAINKAMVFVGGNDGMLHAIRDCDGSEAWAFAPQDLLPNLRYLMLDSHTYYMDASPSVYIYDADSDGNIETTDGDKVILIIGQRRGGGFYYALDVSVPEVPQYLWRLNATESPSGINTDYAELGQTWSQPEMAKVKIGTGSKIVAIIGAGYDNLNEDGRYGATQTFNGAGTIDGNGQGNETSAGAAGPLNPKGRGVYVVEIAALDSSGAPTFANSGWKVWGYTYANDPGLLFSVPSAATVLDRNFDFHADRFYVGDTGGNMWRFDIKDTSVGNWTGRKIFSANPGGSGPADVGKKLFYKPSVILEVGYEMLFFGSGDREHPLNTAVMDRFYAVKDKNEPGVVVAEDAVDDLYELVDVTTNELQGATTTSSQINTILSDLNNKYGWYIRLDLIAGEKVLSPAVAFREVYFTTYAPSDDAAAQPCSLDNQITARAYVVNLKTGEAVHNLEIGNDGVINNNSRASNGSSGILMRSDRTLDLGIGIPSGVVMAITAGGDVVALVGCGGSLCSPPAPAGGNTLRVYWRKV